MQIYKLTLLFLIIILISGCEDVINVDLDTAAPRLVIEASIQWQKGTSGNEQTVKLTTTTGYFDSNIPTVSGATVFVTDSDDTVFNFSEEFPNTGIYICSDFVPEIEKTYVLTVVLNGETYTATETLKSVAEITRIEQNNEGGFSGSDIEIKTFFNDPADANNYYMFRYKPSVTAIPGYEVDEDEFFQGNEFFGFYTNEDIDSGDNLEVTLYGISKRYFEYMNKLINVAGGNSGGPFSTPPATVRGNIVNQTNSKNYALGYFNLSETDFRSYIIE